MHRFLLKRLVGKHIFCEKPIDADVDRIQQVLAEVEKAVLNSKSVLTAVLTIISKQLRMR